MRIETKGLTAPSTTSATRTSGAGGRFSLPEAARGEARSPVASLSSASSLDTVLALQGDTEQQERRRRATRRGHGLLDDLERVKIALLSGQSVESSLVSLRQSLQGARLAAGDPALEQILDQIELRAAVELAKRDVRNEPGG